MKREFSLPKAQLAANRRFKRCEFGAHQFESASELTHVCNTPPMEILPSLITALSLIGLLSFVAQRSGIPAPVLLAVAGVVWSLIPSVPSLEIEPAVILSVFLPPLLYADAWEASWIDFRRWLRPILQLANGLVAFTILMVGLVAHWMMPTLRERKSLRRELGSRAV